jgi:hypothetical protein
MKLHAITLIALFITSLMSCVRSNDNWIEVKRLGHQQMMRDIV